MELATLTRLGTERPFVACDEMVRWFFSIFDFPKLTDDAALRHAIASGTERIFGYVSAATVEDGYVTPPSREVVRFGEPTR